MKKICAFMIATLMTLMTLSAVSAQAAGFPEGYPGSEEAYQLYKPSEEDNSANVIPSWGYIGVDSDIVPDPDPEIPPTVSPEDADSFINVEVPVQTMWAAFQSEGGNIVSPQYNITNKDAKATLSVTVESYTQTNEVSVPAGLHLTLTGDLARSNIIGLSGNADAATQSFAPGQILTFGFGGTYAGTYPVEALQPKYDMTLKFAVLEIAA